MDTITQGAKLVGAQRVAFAGSGIDLSEGTPMDVMAETVANIELDALRALKGREQEAKSLRRRSAAAGAVANANANATILGGATQGLGTAASFYLRSTG